MDTLREQFGGIDIYLFDQLLRGRVAPGATVLDAGCGDGRNLVYLLRAGHPVYAADERPQAVAAVQALAARLAPSLPASNFRCEPVEAMSFEDGIAELVLSSAVLHFARDHAHFRAMLAGTWRTVRPGGMLFCRLASTIGLGGLAQPLGDGRFRLPDGTDRYLVDEELLLETTAAMGGELLDPLKTTNVQNQRCMTTWVVRRLPGGAPEKRGTSAEDPAGTKAGALKGQVVAALRQEPPGHVGAALVQFVELQGKYYPPGTVVSIVEARGDSATIESWDGRRGSVRWDALEPAPPPPDNLPRAPAGRYRVIGKDSFSVDEPPYRLGDFETLEEARAAVRESEERQRGAGDLADHLVIYDEWGRVVR